MAGGHAAAAQRQLELLRSEGPMPAQAVDEALSAFEILYRRGPRALRRDPVSEHQVQKVRSRWARIQKRAQRAR